LPPCLTRSLSFPPISFKRAVRFRAIAWNGFSQGLVLSTQRSSDGQVDVLLPPPFPLVGLSSFFSRPDGGESSPLFPVVLKMTLFSRPEMERLPPADVFVFFFLCWFYGRPSFFFSLTTSVPPTFPTTHQYGPHPPLSPFHQVHM